MIENELCWIVFKDTLIGLTAWPWCTGSTSVKARSPTAAAFCAVTRTCRTQRRTVSWCQSLGPWRCLIPARTSLPASFHAFRFQVCLSLYSLLFFSHFCSCPWIFTLHCAHQLKSNECWCFIMCLCLYVVCAFCEVLKRNGGIEISKKATD